MSSSAGGHDNNDQADQGRDDQDGDLVTVVVDPEVCIAGGQCELLAPEVFEIDEDTAVAVVLGDARLDRAIAEQVIDRCPSGAVSIEPQPGPRL